MMKNKCVQFMDDLESRDLTKLEKWFFEASQVWIPPAKPANGNQRILALFRAIFRRYNDLHWKLVEVHQVEDNRCFFISESWGVLRKDLPYSNKIITDVCFDELGRIIHLSDYFKDTSQF